MNPILKSFKYAFTGIFTFIKSERNAKIHLIIAAAVIGLGLFFQLSIGEWAFITFAIGFVIVTEIINTAIENIMDFVSTEQKPMIAKIKDMAAGAVLVAAITALVIGCLVFIPKISV